MKSQYKTSSKQFWSCKAVAHEVCLTNPGQIKSCCNSSAKHWSQCAVKYEHSAFSQAKIEAMSILLGPSRSIISAHFIVIEVLHQELIALLAGETKCKVLRNHRFCSFHQVLHGLLKKCVIESEVTRFWVHTLWQKLRHQVPKSWQKMFHFISHAANPINKTEGQQFKPKLVTKQTPSGQQFQQKQVRLHRKHTVSSLATDCILPQWPPACKNGLWKVRSK